MNNLPDFTNAKVGDLVWSAIFGWGKIFKVDNSLYPIVVEYNEWHSVSHTLEGETHTTSPLPTLFHRPEEAISFYESEIDKKPKRKVTRFLNTYRSDETFSTWSFPTEEEALVDAKQSGIYIRTHKIEEEL